MHREEAPGFLGRPVSGASSTASVSASGSVGPGSPPDMTCPESSKSSSFQSMSFHSDDNSVLDDISHFEDIGLDDDVTTTAAVTSKRPQSRQARTRASSTTPRPSNPYGRSFSADRHGLPAAPSSSSTGPLSPPATRDLASLKGRKKPEIGLGVQQRPTLHAIQTDPRGFTGRSNSLNARSADGHRPQSRNRGVASLSTTSLHLPGRRHRSPSPNLSLVPRDPNTMMTPQRRSSWQSNRERKSIAELEKECEDDEEDDDNIPEGFILDNVPMSPRPNADRPPSRPGSREPSSERPPRERIRSVGNGTPAIAVAQGSLKSPTWKTDAPSPATSPGPRPDRADGPQFPVKGRAKSWNAGWSELSAEARMLTEKLEEHADEAGEESSFYARGRKPEPRVRSALPDLPSLRQASLMIDAMPMSKEKEAVLGRTRPSWLPPKDPNEDKKHWKEYEKMMARSAESDRRREADKMAKSSNRDTTADGLMRIWGDDIIPRWNDAIRERRTRELWWRGVAPRSRGIVWQRAIGNELGLTETSYKAALGRARDSEARVKAGKGDAEDLRRDQWLSKIREDVNSKTWQDLRIFQVGGPLHQSLVDVLSAYAMYRSDIGYVAGCNTVAAILLLNLPTPPAVFIALANVLNRPLSLGFYASDPGVQASAYNLVLQTLSVKSPGLHEHLTRKLTNAEPDTYLRSIFTGLGTSHLAMDECARLWDVYVFEGDAVMVRAATALLLRQEMSLLSAGDAAEVLKALESGGTKNGRVALTGVESDEEKWIKWLREAGKA
ncbi:TBC1 domain family member 12 [Plectosphaerella plurivora]|uniref:TBC1 domain family member 12 n=1 Tax=Plectosphaerella plurivora TaxID=936078 RepID=A0A9P8V4Q4_9PEZI|nr:TBC1 domain family member 12 [Plectosphaerella plurivora]